jgi:uncharacterized protein (DUF39 family)
MAKTIQEINEKIQKGKAVVVTAEEIIGLVDKKGLRDTAKEVDVVTTGTFGPMCSSGVYLNIGHSQPKIKLGGGQVYLNDVPAYAGFAAADVYLGANALPDEDPRNEAYPGTFKYGGGHVIEELACGRDIALRARAYGTDCYPRKELETIINIKDLNETVLFNLRSCYQNYNVAVNLSERIIYTYMGVLKPHLGNANYCSAGQLSPLLNDPYYKSIGIGTKIFLGGGVGFVAWHGTQHNPDVKRRENGTPASAAGTLAVIGDLKQMNPKWLAGTTMYGYGVTLTVGVGVPIAILNEEICRYAAVRDEEIYTQVVDYGNSYPKGEKGSLSEVNYAQLKSGAILVQNKQVPTGALSSYARAKEIAEMLKEWIAKGKFLLTEAVAPLPGTESGYSFKPLKERPIK